MRERSWIEEMDGCKSALKEPFDRFVCLCRRFMKNDAFFEQLAACSAADRLDVSGRSHFN